MRARDLEKFRKRLVEERDRIKESIKEHEAQVRQYDEIGGRVHSNHMADQGTDEFRHEQAFKLLQSENRYLYRIEDALQRIEDGTYGKCELCGEAIAAPRLEALPYARMCIQCAEKEDAKRG
jgi:RNA polymerase-binding protein DksA